MHIHRLFQTGAAYYPEHLTGENVTRTETGEIRTLGRLDRIREDLLRMKRCGLSMIRMGEFSWSSVEKAPGKLDFSLFLETLDCAAQAGMDVILCTPTAAPPKWLIDLHPDILPVTRDGRRIPFGSRRHYDPCHPAYRSEALRIADAYAANLGGHPAVKMWQIDNEIGCHNSVFLFTQHARTRFRDWLHERYAEMSVLNEAWHTAFWSQAYRDWSEIELPSASWADQNPHMELDFRRFWTDIWRDFQKAQAEILRRHSPGRRLTHNFMSQFTDLCPWTMSTDLDIPGFDHYQMEENPAPVSSAWQFALMRSLKPIRKFTVLEQQPLQVNWQKTNRRFSYDWLFLWTIQAAFQGAESMLYFSWQKMYGGSEQYHDGIIPHDVRNPQSWQERILTSVQAFFGKLSRDFELTAMPQPKKDILCIYNSESIWAHEITPQSESYTMRAQLDFLQTFAHESGFALDFAADPEHACEILNNYELLVLPGYAFTLSASVRRSFEAFLERGGRILSLPRTAVKEKNNAMSARPLQLYGDDLFFEDSGALLSDERESFWMDEDVFNGHTWAEKIRLTSDRWRVKGTFSGLYRGAPAVIEYAHGPGRHIHCAVCPPSDSRFFTRLRGIFGLPARGLCSTDPGVAKDVQIVPLSSGERNFLGVLNFGADHTSIYVRHTGRAQIFSAGLDPEEGLRAGITPVMNTIDSFEVPVPARHALLVELLPG